MFSAVTTLSSDVANINTSYHPSFNIKEQCSGRLGAHDIEVTHAEQRSLFSHVLTSCAPGKELCKRLVSTAVFFHQMYPVCSSTVNPALAVSAPLSRREPGAENNVSVWSEPAFYIPFGLGVATGITMLGMCAYDCVSKRLGGCVGERQTQASRGEGSVIYRSSSRVSLPDPDLQLASISSAPSEVVSGAEGGASQPVAQLDAYSLLGIGVEACELSQQVSGKRKADKQPLLPS